MGVVSYDGSTYSSTYNGPPYDGQIVFTTLEDETLSGTFSFKAKDVDPGMFTNIWVTEGVLKIFHTKKVDRTKILDKIQLQQKINRLAWQIYERNYSQKEIVIVGIETRGVELSLRISEVLQNISDIKILNAV